MRKDRRNISLKITNYANRKCLIRVNKNTIVQQENFNDSSIASMDRSEMKKNCSVYRSKCYPEDWPKTVPDQPI